jgi:hypothetical protein
MYKITFLLEPISSWECKHVELTLPFIPQIGSSITFGDYERIIILDMEYDVEEDRFISCTELTNREYKK